ncbi:MAG: hypothetical protein ACLFU8_17695 [Anaerolineales bacterium]
MDPETTTATVRDIMLTFAEETGLTTEREPRRYLWTDAFAVCNFLELHRRTQEERYLELALRLVDQVHRTLGRHREDDRRTGWLSGLSEEEGEEHPTAGGLRIGKPLPERQADEPFDERLEWEREGQYFHYLTKWMYALNRVSRVTGELRYNRWARELATTAHEAFTYTVSPGNQKRMYWKMSVDLSRPLVPSMGQHDPLDGYLTYQGLDAAAPAGTLDEEIEELASICRGKSWVTDDPLGLGGLLSDAYHAAQLLFTGALKEPDLLLQLLEASRVGLGVYVRQSPLSLPVHYRLAFRELGLAIGLHAVERLQALMREQTATTPHRISFRDQVAALARYAPLSEEIESFWLAPSSREATTWTEHLDINRVMLATSLAPEGYLEI